MPFKCQKKIFSSLTEAEKRAHQINEENGSERMRAYQCEICGMFHLSSMRKSKYEQSRFSNFLKLEGDYWTDKLK